jgi:hypothetical protein
MDVFFFCKETGKVEIMRPYFKESSEEMDDVFSRTGNVLMSGFFNTIAKSTSDSSRWSPRAYEPNKISSARSSPSASYIFKPKSLFCSIILKLLYILVSGR